jgi:hypothetical protein
VGAIFISYRRDDSEGHAGRLFEDLVDHFGNHSVFMDVAGLEPGRDFRTAIDDKLSSCSVLLAVMGRSWLDAKDASGRRRLDHPADFVRLETAAALRRGIPVIPVLVHGAVMPSAEQLPADLADLAYRNAVELTHARWESDVRLLLEALAPHVAPPVAESRPAQRGLAPRHEPTIAVAPSAPTESAQSAVTSGPVASRGLSPKTLAAAAAAAVLVVVAWVALGPDDSQGTDQEAQELLQAAPDGADEAPSPADDGAPEVVDERTSVLDEAGGASTAPARERAGESGARTGQTGFGTNGLRVSHVTFGDPRSGRAIGHFVASGQSTWAETGASVDDVRFEFREVDRDDWSVYLEDSSRNMSLQLDLFTRKISIGEIGDKRAPLYDIVMAR